MDAWAPRLAGTGVDHQVRRADQPLLHRGRRLDRQQFLHQWRIQTAAKLAEHFREHEMRLDAIRLDLRDPTGSPSRRGRSATDYRSARQNRSTPASVTPRPTRPVSRPADAHAWWVWESAGRMSRPRPRPRPPMKSISPLADRMRVGDEVGHLEARSPARQPMLEVSSERHRRLS
jgi:hypothetical protein